MTSKRHAEITCPYYRRYKNKKKSLRKASRLALSTPLNAKRDCWKPNATTWKR